MLSLPFVPAAPRSLKTTEAAFVAGVDVSDVNRAFDEQLISTLVLRDGERRLTPIECMFIAMYYRTSKWLNAYARKQILASVETELARVKVNELSKEMLNRDWRVCFGLEDLAAKDLTVDLRRVVQDTLAHFDELMAVQAWATRDPEILGGMPVVPNTRVPVYDIAASVNAGLTPARILEEFPVLTEEDISRAIVYAKANPQRGRRSAKPIPPSGMQLRKRISVSYPLK
jgi:uncharacterized protein (DUF433 family)